MKLAVRPMSVTCFFERDPDMTLMRRATAEGVGTLLLMLATAAPSPPSTEPLP